MPPFGFGRKREPQEEVGMPPMGLPEFPPAEFAAAVHRALAGQRPPAERTAQILAGVVAQLSLLAGSPGE